MKVKELIEALSLQNQDLEVMIYDGFNEEETIADSVGIYSADNYCKWDNILRTTKWLSQFPQSKEWWIQISSNL